jgi:hypothetical protein
LRDRTFLWTTPAIVTICDSLRSGLPARGDDLARLKLSRYDGALFQIILRVAAASHR